MSLICQQCQQPLSPGDGEWICNACGAHYAGEPCCPACHQPLEQLKACGAVNYFCRHGHGLISSKRVVFQPPAD